MPEVRRTGPGRRRPRSRPAAFVFHRICEMRPVP